jgi:cell division topological specificity factor
MGWLDSLFGSRSRGNSASVAKQRLVEVLVQDHIKLTPEEMDAMRRDIAKVLSRHLDIDPGQVMINITRSASGENLVANVPVKRMVGSRPS